MNTQFKIAIVLAIIWFFAFQIMRQIRHSYVAFLVWCSVTVVSFFTAILFLIIAIIKA